MAITAARQVYKGIFDMIYTLTLNPAIDKAVYLDSLHIDAVNRVSYTKLNAGGKGINISRALRQMQVDSVAFAFTGGQDGAKLQELSQKDGVALACVETAAPTRENVKIIDVLSRTFTDLNEAGGPVTLGETTELLDRLMSAVRPGDIVALSGSVPAGIPKKIYQDITNRCHALGVKVVADCDGEALSHCIAALPDVIKPNNFELSELLKRPLPDRDALIEGAQELVHLGIGAVLITLGGDGALSVSKEGVFHAAGIKVPVLSTVGAGDTFLAGYIKAMTLGENAARSLARAMSASTAKVQFEGTDMPGQNRLEEYLPKLEINRL